MEDLNNSLPADDDYTQDSTSTTASALKETGEQVADPLWKRITDGMTYLMQKAREALEHVERPEDLIRFARYPSPRPSGGPVVLLGTAYANSTTLDFLNDFQSRIWITYRKGFPAISTTSYQRSYKLTQ